MDAPDPQWTDEDWPSVSALLAQHFVGIALTVRQRSGGEQPHLASAFVISVRGKWFLVTAGHVLQQILNAQREGALVGTPRLLDPWNSRPGSIQNNEPIPFELTEENHFLLDEDGIDFGVVHLGGPQSNLVALLQAGDVTPIDDALWGTPLPGPAVAILVGLPRDLKRGYVSTARGQMRVSFDAEIAMLPLQPVGDEELPANMRPLRKGRYHARVGPGTLRLPESEVVADDIDGMSGGPIFHVCKSVDGTFKYRAVAVQHAWDRPTRIIAATLLHPLSARLATILDGMLAA